MTWLENAILAVVEGITEYLPVSSTGHLMMFKEWLKLSGDQLDTYMISIQFGAIFSVVVLYWNRFFTKNWFSFYSKLLVGFIPAAILGYLFDDLLESLLQTPVIVGIMLIGVGIFLVFMDRILTPGNKEVDDVTYKDAAIIGLIQTIAMIPGTSRSAATIAGGLGCKLSKSAATEFSFFLAIPTLSAAAAYKVLKNWDQLSASNISDIAIGNVISFVTAAIAVKFFIGIVKSKGFAFFGYYRILIGTIFLLSLYL
jgi:undecaprenyl-diphosphatase